MVEKRCKRRKTGIWNYEILEHYSGIYVNIVKVRETDFMDFYSFIYHLGFSLRFNCDGSKRGGRISIRNENGFNLI